MLYYYNPTAEIEIGKRAYYYEPKPLLGVMQNEMAGLMAFLAENDGDYVITDREQPPFVKDFWRKIGLKNVLFAAPEKIKALALEHEICAWSNSYGVAKLKGLQFREEDRIIQSRWTSVAVEKRIREELPECGVDTKVVDSIEGVEESVTTGTVVKSLWSSSGRGVIIVDKEKKLSLAKKFAADNMGLGGVIVEPLLKKREEYTHLFRITDEGVYYEGTNRYGSTEDGKFGVEFIGDEYVLSERHQEVLRGAIDMELRQKGYRGMAGVDAMLQELPDGKFADRLCVELNARYTMGHVNQRIKLYFAPGTKGVWKIEYFKDYSMLEAYLAKMQNEYPLVIEDAKVARGFFVLAAGTNFVACGVAF